MGREPNLVGMAEHRAQGTSGLRVRRGLTIPDAELQLRTSTPGGPGGQHANRTASRVTVSFDVEASAVLGPRQRARLVARLGPVVRVSASESRSQAVNRERALHRLAVKLSEALSPEARRVATKPTKASAQRRVEAKRRRGSTKAMRRRPGPDD